MDIQLLSGVDLGVILVLPTGVTYTHQCDGVACQQKSVEGAYLPLAVFPGLDNPQHHALAEYFARRDGNRGEIYEPDAQFIDQFLAETELPFTARVMRTRLFDSFEAWVWLDLSPMTNTAPEFLRHHAVPKDISSPLTAVLVWENSD